MQTKFCFGTSELMEGLDRDKKNSKAFIHGFDNRSNLHSALNEKEIDSNYRSVDVRV